MNDFEKAMKNIKICSERDSRCSDCEYYYQKPGCIHSLLVDSHRIITEYVAKKKAQITELERLLDEQKTNGQF